MLGLTQAAPGVGEPADENTSLDAAIRRATAASDGPIFRMARPDEREVARDVEPEKTKARAVRRKLWQVPAEYHCSLLGMCLGLEEMRRVARQVGVERLSERSDLEVHHALVKRASSSDRGARRMHRHIEDKYAAAVRAFADVRDVDGLRARWEVACEHEEIGGAYWALLSHALIDEDLAFDALGHVHMLSHTTAANARRDHRRRVLLEARVDELQIEAERARASERALRQELASLRQAAGREADLRAALRRMQSQIARLEGRRAPDARVTDEREARLASLEERLDSAEAAARYWRARYRALGTERDDEGQVRTAGDGWTRAQATPAEVGSETVPPCARDGLAGTTIAYVGGHDRLLPELRAVAERFQARLVHHDGGISERARRLDEQLSGCDLVMVPVPCVSHDACRRLKRHCRAGGKPVVWLRSAGVSAFERAVARAAELRHPA